MVVSDTTLRERRGVRSLEALSLLTHSRDSIGARGRRCPLAQKPLGWEGTGKTRPTGSSSDGGGRYRRPERDPDRGLASWRQSPRLHAARTHLSTTRPNAVFSKRSRSCGSVGATTHRSPRPARRAQDQRCHHRQEAQERGSQGQQPPTQANALVGERTNAWLSNFSQLRVNTDRKSIHRVAQLALAAAKLIRWRSHWSPLSAPHPQRT